MDDGTTNFPTRRPTPNFCKQGVQSTIRDDIADRCEEVLDSWKDWVLTDGEGPAPDIDRAKYEGQEYGLPPPSNPNSHHAIRTRMANAHLPHRPPADLEQRPALLTIYEQPNPVKVTDQALDERLRSVKMQYDSGIQHEKVHVQRLVTQREIPSVATEMNFLRSLFTTADSFEFVVVALSIPSIMTDMITAFAAELASPPLNR
ncbi:hypothetical protein FQN54_005633 [Arachnomyces sp. PD_36]|nr:hypothetical protein FQN54_005633 [Arachnomyces sp. PD_36]